MKTRRNHFISCFLFIIALSAVVIFGCRCTTSKPVADPLVGWHLCFSQDPGKLDKTIQDDYRDFIQKLPPNEKNYIGNIAILENGTGQHAISIEVFANSTNASWHYALFYNEQNKRINVVKYGYKRYMS